MIRIEVVTDIRPDAQNRGGPSGLIFEVVQAVQAMPNVSVLLNQKVPPTSRVLLRLAQLLIRLPSSSRQGRPNIDVIIAYPSTALRHVAWEDFPRTIVLGPDSQGLLYRRAVAVAHGWSRLRARLLMHWFTRVEADIARRCAAFAVVGRTDVRWMKRTGQGAPPARYLPHPLLSEVLLPIDRIGGGAGAAGRPVVLFAGAINSMYSGGFLEEFARILVAEQSNLGEVLFHFVGDNYRPLAERLRQAGLETKVESWVDHYEELLARHVVQPVCLRVGGGTKNRVLTAIANGAYVLGTLVALENCRVSKSTGLSRLCLTPRQMANDLKAFLRSARPPHAQKIAQIEAYRFARQAMFIQALTVMIGDTVAGDTRLESVSSKEVLPISNGGLEQ